MNVRTECSKQQLVPCDPLRILHFLETSTTTILIIHHQQTALRLQSEGIRHGIPYPPLESRVRWLVELHFDTLSSVRFAHSSRIPVKLSLCLHSRCALPNDD